MPLRAFFMALLLVPLLGCDHSPTEPAHQLSPSLHVACLPDGSRVSCKATLSGVPDGASTRDVTSQATWMASDPSLGSFLQPGVFTPRRRGEVEISASYQTWTSDVTSQFLVDPAQPAQRLYFLSGVVRDDSSNAEIPGATVEILDGYARGATSVTNESGAYHFDKILTGETFHIRVSKPGYSPVTLSYRVDSPIGPAGGNPPFLDFRLHRTS
ncbi:MAG TPA: carboxypeptidase-like regulatory domain-containing protein [Thermoanaerobaculia bacterium]